MKEQDVPLVYVSAISTVLIGCNLFTVYSGLHFLGYISMVSLRVFVVALGVLWLLNHLLFVKGKPFLNFCFDSSSKGSLFILAYFLITISTFVFLANKNRERIFSERDKAKIEIQESLR